MKKYKIDGEFVRALRAGMGLDQVAFAEKIGATDRSVRNWESGRTTPQGAARKNILKLAEKK